MSTYTPNLGIELIVSGTGAGTWGDSTNNNLLQLDQSIGGSGAEQLTAAGSSGSPNIVYITNSGDRSALSVGRNAYINFTDDGSLASADAYVRFEEDTCERLIWVTNSLTQSDNNLIIMQGTYHVDRAYILPQGATVLLRFDGAGISNAAVTSAFQSTVIDNNKSLSWKNFADDELLSITVNASDDMIFTDDGVAFLYYTHSSGQVSFTSGDVLVTQDIYVNSEVYVGNSVLDDDDLFYLGTESTIIPKLNFDDTDFISYNRGSNTYNFTIAGSAVMTLSATVAQITGDAQVLGDLLVTQDITANSEVYAGNSVLTVDDLFYMGAVNANLPALTFDTDSYLSYSRVSSQYNMLVAGSPVLAIDATNMNLYPSDKVQILTADVEFQTAGKGLDLSAVANTTETGSTTTNEVFSAYSEGAWTPVLYDGTTDATMDGNTLGHYTRIGNTVFCRFRCGTSSVAALSGGTLFIRGLPFPAAATVNIEGGGTATNGEFLNITAGTSLTLLVESNKSHMWVFEWDGTSGSSGVTKTQWTDNGVIRGVIQYETDA